MAIGTFQTKCRRPIKKVFISLSPADLRLDLSLLDEIALEGLAQVVDGEDALARLDEALCDEHGQGQLPGAAVVEVGGVGGV